MKTNKWNDNRDSSFVLYNKQEAISKTFYSSGSSVRIYGWEFSIYKFDASALEEWVNLQNLNLQILRNGIFARHGYKFKDGGKMDNYFGKLSWYHPTHKNVDNLLSETEKHNIKMIQSIESRYKKYPNSKIYLKQLANFPTE